MKSYLSITNRKKCQLKIIFYIFNVPERWPNGIPIIGYDEYELLWLPLDKQLVWLQSLTLIILWLYWKTVETQTLMTIFWPWQNSVCFHLFPVFFLALPQTIAFIPLPLPTKRYTTYNIRWTTTTMQWRFLQKLYCIIGLSLNSNCVSKAKRL